MFQSPKYPSKYCLFFFVGAEQKRTVFHLLQRKYPDKPPDIQTLETQIKLVKYR